MSDNTDSALAAGAPLLAVRDLRVALGHGRKRREILHGVNAHVAPGEIVGLIGETGSGKTTLARSILGINRLDSGSVRVAGTDVGALAPRALRAFRRAGEVQYVFQDPLQSLDPDLAVFASVAEGLRVREAAAGSAAARAASRITLRDRVDRALQLVGLPAELGDRLPAELSGGQRQRVAIARAMVLEPRVLICDEPVSALDATNRIAMLELLVALRDDRPEMGLLFISHDLGSIAGITDRILVLYRGQVVEDGPTSAILRAPQHPYTRLLVGSAPTLTGGEVDRDRRRELRLELAAVE
jgi:ABC-type glutathione transport system ATPase component